MAYRRQEEGMCREHRKKKNTACTALQSKSLGSSDILFFFFFNSMRPRLCHLIFKCRRNWGRAPPRPPAQSSGISQEHQVGQQDAGPERVQGGLQAAHPHRSRPSLACLPIHTRELCCVCLSLPHTHPRARTHTNTHRRHALTKRLPSISSDLFSCTLTVIQKQLQNSSWFFYFRASGYGLSIRYEDRRREM